jgi:hypothetical protein
MRFKLPKFWSKIICKGPTTRISHQATDEMCMRNDPPVRKNA